MKKVMLEKILTLMTEFEIIRDAINIRHGERDASALFKDLTRSTVRLWLGKLVTLN